MNFDLDEAILILERTPKVLRVLLQDLPEDWTHQNEGTSTWSPFDVLGHLIHGEETDWIPRAKIILSQRNEAFTPFDRFAQEEKSKGKTMEQLLAQFADIREKNLLELSELNIKETDLDLTGKHPELGEVTLKNLLSTWTAHDLSHLSQITRVMAKQYREEIGIWTKYMNIMHT